MILIGIAALIYATAYTIDVIYTIRHDKDDEVAKIPDGDIGDFFI